ncbi:MAG: helix-turn-helix domain-containing protein [Clostridia bacterium]|nr:helix-turn-helix domain-containing protein [Clostridia bacterium]
MLDMKTFGEKLRNHRKHLGLSQENVAEKIGVSAQAVSKWENGECLPDCFNLKSLGETYGVSLDILLETETTRDVNAVAAKIEQLADEFVWATESERDVGHRDLGENLLTLWKGIYFIEAGNREIAQRDKEAGNLRIMSDYGMKIWDDDGVVAVVKSDIREKLANVGERELNLIGKIASPECIRLITSLDTCTPTPKDVLAEKTGLELPVLNELLLMLLENKVIEHVFGARWGRDGYKMCGHFGMAAYLVLAAAFVLGKPVCCVSEYVHNWVDTEKTE